MLNRVARLRLDVKECSTCKSDVWSVGVTFFEILIGRTPFEKSVGEQRKIWRSTWGTRGKWVGKMGFFQGNGKVIAKNDVPERGSEVHS